MLCSPHTNHWDVHHVIKISFTSCIELQKNVTIIIFCLEMLYSQATILRINVRLLNDPSRQRHLRHERVPGLIGFWWPLQLTWRYAGYGSVSGLIPTALLGYVKWLTSSALGNTCDELVGLIFWVDSKHSHLQGSWTSRAVEFYGREVKPNDAFHLCCERLCGEV